MPRTSLRKSPALQFDRRQSRRLDIRENQLIGSSEMLFELRFPSNCGVQIRLAFPAWAIEHTIDFQGGRC